MLRSFDLQKDLMHAEFTEAKVHCDAAHCRLVERLRMRKNKFWSVEDQKKMLFSDESHFFVKGKNSIFTRIWKGEHLSPAHYNEAVKESKRMFWGSYSFSVVSLVPIEGMMN